MTRDGHNGMTGGRIAIVGMACRYPEADSVDELWECTLERRAAFSEIPPDRWDHRGFYSTEARDADRTYVGVGGFLRDVRRFAALHFGMAPRRLEVMDPQHRLLLSTVRVALQDAGLETAEYDRERVGTFFGLSSSEYRSLLIARITASLMAQGAFGEAPADPAALEALQASVGGLAPIRAFTIPGILLNMAAANVAQQWDFGGPAYVVDAACASSLLAIHDAVLHLRTGRCDMAVAGGVYLNLSPESLVGFSRIGAVSRSGRCRPFDADADGFLQGEGVGVVILKRLEDALRDGDRIHAVILGVGVSNDGRSDGPMTPSAKGQIRAMRRAWEDAGADPRTVGLIECQGTATPVSDPVELESLRAVFPAGGPDPIWLSSVKANIGHTMSAAGIAGVIRATMALKERTIPPQAGFERPHPKLELEQGPFRITTQPVPWESRPGQTRRAAVSAFGFGGTNGHLVLEEAPETTLSGRPRIEGLERHGAPEVFVLSAPNRLLLARHAREMRRTLERGQARAAPLADLAWTLNVTRRLFASRLAVVAHDRTELQALLLRAAERLEAGPAPLRPEPALFVTPDGGPGPEAESYLEAGAGDPLSPPGGFPLEDERLPASTSPAADDGHRRLELCRTLGLLAVLGVPVRFQAFYAGEGRRVVSLPAPPLEEEPYWAIKRPERAAADRRGDGAHPHPTVGGTITTQECAMNPDSPLPQDLIALFREQTAVLQRHAEIIARQSALLTGMPLEEPKDAAPGAEAEASQEIRAPRSRRIAVDSTLVPPDAQPPSRRPAPSLEQVLDIVSRVSAFPKEVLKSEQRLTGELGFDSLMLADLGARLEAVFPQISPIPRELLSPETTVADLAAFIDRTSGVTGHSSLEGGTDWDIGDTGTAPAPARAGAPAAGGTRLEPHAETTAPELDGHRSARFPLGRTAWPGPPPEAWHIDHFPEVRALEARLEGIQTAGLRNPYFTVHEGTARDTSIIGGRRMINFSSYNYLGYSGHPRVVEAVKAAVERYGTSVSASRLVSGERPLHRDLEANLARVLGCEASLVFVSGHATNVTVVGHLFGEGDLILHDALAHDSIVQGAKLSGARRRPFPHNDWQALERALAQLRPHYRRVLIAIEGAYSMDGDYPDLPRFLELRDRYRCLLLVDEAHSFGVMGDHGWGIGEHYHVERSRVDIWMGTLSKSLASCGGYIAGSSTLIEYLKYTVPGFVYSAGMSPANTAAALESLRLMMEDSSAVRQLHQNCRLFLGLLKERGIDTGMSADTAVIPCIVGDSTGCLMLSARLAERGINVQPIIYPAVEENLARLRFFISATHNAEQLRTTADILAGELEEVRRAMGAAPPYRPSYNLMEQAET